MKKLSLGIQDFEKIINNNFIYVDKTEYIYNLINLTNYYFISRPRRFGKSLMLSTIENIFKNKKNLFKDFFIFKSDYIWKEYPVIRFDFSKQKESKSDILREFIRDKILNTALEYNIKLNENRSNSFLFDDLLKEFGKLGGAVILVDEYDSPIVNKLNNKNEGEENIKELNQIFSQIKGNDENIKFCFFSGISKFTKTSVFSELNNLMDITINDKFSKLFGYTEEEIKFYFKDYIDIISNKLSIDKNDLILKLKYWYNGYSFNNHNNYEKIYNPFSVLNFFEKGVFENYWIESGNTKFLIDMIKNKNYEEINMDRIEIDNTNLSSIDFDHIKLETLLFQTGYLTIEKYNNETGVYHLKIPNNEIRKSFFNKLLIVIYDYRKTIDQLYIERIKKLLKENSFDELFKNIQYYLSGIPYDIKISSERYYQSALYHLFNFTSMRARTEQTTNVGRIDLVVETESSFYIFELKLDSTAEKAIEQVLEREYYKEFFKYDKDIFIFGVNFDSKKGNLNSFKILNAKNF